MSTLPFRTDTRRQLARTGSSFSIGLSILEYSYHCPLCVSLRYQNVYHTCAVNMFIPFVVIYTAPLEASLYLRGIMYISPANALFCWFFHCVTTARRELPQCSETPSLSTLTLLTDDRRNGGNGLQSSACRQYVPLGRQILEIKRRKIGDADHIPRSNPNAPNRSHYSSLHIPCQSRAQMK